MPFYIVHVCGRSPGRRASVDPEGFDRPELAEVAAIGRAIGEARRLEDLAT